MEDVQLATIGWGPVINPSTFSNNGFYEIVHQPEGAANILYTDFATGTQMYLCSRPECLHNKNSCNSYIEENIDTGRLLMNKDKSLLINIRGEKAAGTEYLPASTSAGNDFYAYSLSKKKKSLVYSTKYEEAKGVMFEDDLYLFEKKSKEKHSN